MKEFFKWFIPVRHDGIYTNDRNERVYTSWIMWFSCCFFVTKKVIGYAK